MTIYKARKLSFSAYLVAAVMLFICLLFEPAPLVKYVLYAGMAVFFLVGFYIATQYSRCPKCGHVVQVGLFKVTQCTYCNHPLTEKTTKDM